MKWFSSPTCTGKQKRNGWLCTIFLSLSYLSLCLHQSWKSVWWLEVDLNFLRFDRDSLRAVEVDLYAWRRVKSFFKRLKIFQVDFELWSTYYVLYVFVGICRCKSIYKNEVTLEDRVAGFFITFFFFFYYFAALFYEKKSKNTKEIHFCMMILSFSLLFFRIWLKQKDDL